jgi:hypothetical protein
MFFFVLSNIKTITKNKKKKENLKQLEFFFSRNKKFY